MGTPNRKRPGRRALEPASFIVTSSPPYSGSREGTVKVLDFGLAKLAVRYVCRE